MLRGLFVTGTDTGAGKTVASAALMLHVRQFAQVRYWKPIETGIEENDDTAVVRELAACSDDEIYSEGIRLKRPLSPHLAARLSGQPITNEKLEKMASALGAGANWVIEGAGGVSVPINDSCLMIDWIEQLGLPVLVAARSRLGTINHTLLTLDALRNRGLQVAGVVMSGEPNRENRYAIEHYGKTAVFGEIPVLSPLTNETLARWVQEEFDRSNGLREFFAG